MAGTGLFLHDFPHSIGYLPTGRVAQGDDHGHRVVVAGMLLCLMKLGPHLAGQPPDITDDTEAHVVLHEYLILERGQHESHERVYLRLRPVPVFRGEGIERQIFHAQPRTLSGDAAHGLDTGLVAVAAVLAPLGGPAAVAVHDDGNVPGNACHIKLYHIRFVYSLLQVVHFAQKQ